MADDVLTTAVQSISGMITGHSNVHIDIRDVNTVMKESGVALMGYGSAEGEDRAIDAIEKATKSPLLNDNNIHGAKKVLLYISTSSDKKLTMSEFDEISQFVRKETGHGNTTVIWGKGRDESLGDKISVTLIATGFSEAGKKPEPPRIPWDEEYKPETYQATAPETQTPSQPKYDLDDDFDGFRAIEKPIEPKKVAEPNSLEATLDIFSQQISAPPKTQIVNELPNRDEPFLRSERTDAPSLNTERFQVHSADRVQQLRDLSAKVKTIEGLEELEREPAYMRYDVKLVEPAHSSASEAPRYCLTDDGHVTKNGFLHDNVD